MTDKALSSLQDTGEADTGALLYVVSRGNSRGIHPGNLQVGLSDGDKGDIIVSDTGTVWLLDNIADTGLPGSYTRADITVDAKGRVIAAADGTGGSVSGVFLPEDFGAVGDGVADDELAMGDTFDAIVAAGGGELWCLPDATYRYDLSGSGFATDEISGLVGLHINGRGATLDYDIAFADDAGAWAYMFDNCDMLTIENVNTVAEDGHGTNGQPRGMRHWTIRQGGEQSIFRNLNMTGGLGGIFVDGVDVSGPPNSVPNHQVIIENCRAEDTFYPVSLQGGNNCIVRNLRAVNAGRSMYVSDVEGLEASVYNINHTHNDLILQCNTNTSSAGIGKRLGQIKIDYHSRVTTGEEAGSCIILGLNTAAASPQACVVHNIDLTLDVDGSDGDGIAGVFNFQKLIDGVSDTTQRGHIIDGLRIRGTAIDITQGGGIDFGSDMKSGDVFRRVEIGPFYMRKKSGAPDSDIVIDGAAFTTPLVLHDIDIDGDLTVTNFAAGMLDIRNCSFANFSTQANVGTSGFNKVTWGADSVNPSLGNGTLTSRYLRDGKLVTWSLSLTMGNTTTFGTGNWFFSLQSPFAELPRHKAICAWRGLDFGTTVLSGTGDIGTDGKIRLYIQNNGGTLTATNPITWASGDEIHLTATYEV